MKKNWARLLAVLLGLSMLFSLIPSAFAAEPNATIAANAEKDLRYLALDDENNGPHDLYYQQKIMNPVVEDSFVLWYNGKNTNYPISWTSSDPSLIVINDITHMAELTHIPEQDTEVTLTATMAVPYASGSSETYPMEKKLVVKVPCMKTRLQMDYDALTITNMNDVRENLPLLTHGKYGSEITWESSNPDVVSVNSVRPQPTTKGTDEEQAPISLYDGGVVTRPAYGEAPAKVTLTAYLYAAGIELEKSFNLTITPLPKAVPAENYDHYLFVCYAENYDWNQDKLTTEEIYFGLSEDGMNWKNINVNKINGKEYTQPILRSTVGDMGTRDPHIIRSHDGDKFYVLATDLHAIGDAVPERDGAEFKRSSFDCVNGNRDLVIWETNDLSDWGEPRLVKCNFASAGDTYAPEAIWDENEQAYLVYWASKDNAELNADGTYKPNKVGKIYYCYTRDFNTFSEPKLWLSSTDEAMKKAFPSTSGEYDIYDTTIRYDPYDGLYYRFGTKNRLYVQTSESLSGPWSDAVALAGGINNSGVEAPTTYQLPDGSWMLLGDNYRQYVPYQAAHLADFISGNYKSLSFTYASNGPRYKHGTIIPITEEEYNLLVTAYNNSIPKQEAPAIGEGYTIDNEAETIELKDGYALRTPASDLSELAGETLYIRKEATPDARASDWTAIDVPQRKETPKVVPIINSGMDSLSVANSDQYPDCEFSIGGSWNDTGIFTELEAETAYMLQIRAKADDKNFASLPLRYETATAAAFTDIKPADYFYDAVLWANRQGITTGMTSTTFAPKGSCTRAQMVTFLWRAVGRPEPTSQVQPFKDVKAGEYYEKAVLWAVEKGITKGTSLTTFSPDRTVTRGQAITFLWRTVGEPEASVTSNFTDVPKDMYYWKAVNWAVDQKITNGLTSTTFGPDANCIRSQIVTFLYRLFM